MSQQARVTKPRGQVALVLIAVFLLALVFIGSLGNNEQESSAAPRDHNDDHVVVDEMDHDEKCDVYAVKLDQNESNRLLSDGAHGSATKVRKIIARAAGYDPRILKLYWNARFPNKAVGSESGLVEGGELRNGACYTDEAQEMHQQLKAQLYAAAVKNGQAPSYGTNTGAYQGGSGFQISGAISGNRKATKVVFANGKTIWIMHRCGNVVTKKPIPKVPPFKPTPKKCTAQMMRDGFCGTPTSGPEQYHAADPGRTDGYEPGNAEEVVENQPISDDPDTDCGQYGCNSGSKDGAPAGESENTDTGEEEQGTDEGTSDPEKTEGSQEEDEANSGDPSPPP